MQISPRFWQSCRSKKCLHSSLCSSGCCKWKASALFSSFWVTSVQGDWLGGLAVRGDRMILTFEQIVLLAQYFGLRLRRAVDLHGVLQAEDDIDGVARNHHLTWSEAKARMRLATRLNRALFITQLTSFCLVPYVATTRLLLVHQAVNRAEHDRYTCRFSPTKRSHFVATFTLHSPKIANSIA